MTAGARRRPPTQSATTAPSVSHTNRSCPDCGVTAVDRRLVHDTTCPLGLGIDRVCSDDRRWFETHPAADFYWREVDPWEVADLRAAGAIPDIPGRPVGRVRVTRLAEGVRVRSFGDVCILLVEAAE